MDETSAWLTLHRTPGIGARTLVQLLERFGQPNRILSQAPSRLRESGLGQESLSCLLAPDPAALERELGWLECPGHHLITILSDDYPKLLRDLPDPPPLLFVCGDPELLHLPQLAVVGSRRPSPGGQKTARDFSKHLAFRGLAITSGLADGIDGAAHRGALEGGRTLAVMGTGVDRIYPACNRELAHAIVGGGGALVSELPLGSAPLAGNFPRRNRIISGLSLGVLVVEAALRSGSLITARLASEQGREVFAIPGSIHNPMARGCHALIRNGAKLVESAQDIVEELAPLLGTLLEEESEGKSSAAGDQPKVDEDYRQLLENMGFDPVTVDELVQRSGRRVEEVSSMLLLLELEGHVLSAPGGFYCRVQ
ncbi:MAG: DNA-processing protein DprA [Gammaproteobacteria bacterium]|nr:DNA-processing protein DprA [Gammaproteobacteria bacterium]MBU1656320.1 DNA-processing protein DprA [Gammaproteobacteria bacterium]MBU1959885.1 DNA-processing protein DprA [Gammaproteobacteria bacterium]